MKAHEPKPNTTIKYSRQPWKYIAGCPALREVVAWGDPAFGGDASPLQSRLRGVEDLLLLALQIGGFRKLGYVFDGMGCPDSHS